MTKEQEVYNIIKPFLEGYTEGLNWDFKKTLSDTGEIIKDILAFANSNQEKDSYIIVGVSEPKNKNMKKISLTTKDRRRLNTSEKYLYLPGKWEINGLNAEDINNMKQFCTQLTQKITTSMLICHPKCEFMPIQIKEKLWIYVIIIKHTPGVFITKKDIKKNTNNKIVVKERFLYVRTADTTTIGTESNVATATEYVRVWKRYIDHLNHTNDNNYKGNIDESFR